MIRLLLIGAIRLYRWCPPRGKRCPLTPGCSETALAAVRAGTMGIAGVFETWLACCPAHSAGWTK